MASAPEPTAMDVFVYGSLTEPALVERVVDSYSFLGSATLEGLHPVQGHYPTLAPGDRTGGRLLRTDDVAALDAYEGVDTGLYVRASVPLADEVVGNPTSTATVYVGDPDALGVEASVEWPGAGSFAERVERYLAVEGVRVRLDDDV